MTSRVPFFDSIGFMNNQIGRLHQNNYQEEDQKDEHASHHYWIVTRARGEGVKYVIAHASTTYIS